MSTSDLSSNEELYEWLSSFSAALAETTKRGKDAGRELIYSLDSFINRIEQYEFPREYVSSLGVTQQLLEAALQQHDKNLASDSESKNDVDVNDDASIKQKDFHASQNTSAGSSRNSPYLVDSNNINCGKEEELDNFAASRRQAIESTILRELDNLPKFNDIAGLAEAKSALFEALVDPIQYPEWFRSSDMKPWKTVLLYGPPGTGKSILSQAIVRESNSLLYQVTSSDLISTWCGQSEKLIRELFEHAVAQKKTAVIFIDEVDSLCKRRCSNEDDSTRRVKTELLLQLQRLQSTSNIVLICATNCPWDLDPAFLRRFEKKIYVGLPDFEARLIMLNQRLSNTTMESGVSKEWMADMTNGFSGDDIRRFASELAYTQFRYYKENMLRSDGNKMRRPLSRQDIEYVLASFSPSVDARHLARFEQYKNK